jgi:hypothetical protein
MFSPQRARCKLPGAGRTYSSSSDHLICNIMRTRLASPRSPPGGLGRPKTARVVTALRGASFATLSGAKRWIRADGISTRGVTSPDPADARRLGAFWLVSAVGVAISPPRCPSGGLTTAPYMDQSDGRQRPTPTPGPAARASPRIPHDPRRRSRWPSSSSHERIYAWAGSTRSMRRTKAVWSATCCATVGHRTRACIESSGIRATTAIDGSRASQRAAIAAGGLRGGCRTFRRCGRRSPWRHQKPTGTAPARSGDVTSS